MTYPVSHLFFLFTTPWRPPLKHLDDSQYTWLREPAELDAVENCRVFVVGQPGFEALPGSKRFKLELALEEVLVNVVHYAYKDEKGWLELGVHTCPDQGTVCVRIKDGGHPFNPLLKEEPDLTLDIQDRQIGGLGIYLVKNMVDDLEYERRDNMNVATFCVTRDEQE
ncbi:MAG: ATP-binding protein [Spartobacteria bacterium]|nr:ATP-binding protein [Spartobacteria bacterium]